MGVMTLFKLNLFFLLLLIVSALGVVGAGQRYQARVDQGVDELIGRLDEVVFAQHHQHRAGHGRQFVRTHAAPAVGHAGGQCLPVVAR